MKIEPYGENGIRIIFGNEIDAETHQHVRRCYTSLKSLELRGVAEIIPSFLSCLVIFDTRVTSYERLASLVEEQDWGADLGRQEPVVYEIPVMYGGEYGPDLEFVCEYCGLTEEKVIEIHSSSVYTVFTVGFMPGFPYCGPLDKRLFTPRLDTPRLKVPEGSVGIARLQTGVYTFDSPGGWRIIGKTNRRLFDCERKPYSLLNLGDLVRFVPE